MKGLRRIIVALAGHMCLALTLTVAYMPAATAQQAADASDGLLTIDIGPGDSLRSIAAEYLKNPDLWPIILDVNNLTDITEIYRRKQIQIPVEQVKLSLIALDTSLRAIQTANAAGAQIFAPVLIENAIRFRETALQENKRGDYGKSISLSAQSITSAGNATTKSEQSRDVEAEARLSDRQGTVEGQKVEETSWTDRALNATLNEREKIRTLSRSTAQVVFRDASRLRLNPNSQAVIQRMRVDPLKRNERAKISLVEGNFYALLGADSQRSNLEVDLPNVNASIDSGNFFVSQESDSAKFSNYDTKPVAITAGDETLVLGQNQGTLVRDGDVPDQAVSVLDRIQLSSPTDDAILYGQNVALSWQEIQGGGNEFWLEVAADPRFDKMAETRFGLKGTSISDVSLTPGIYYWRVAALDAFGLPGQMSPARRFEVRIDDQPPFLQILAPAEGSIFRTTQIELVGSTELGASIQINGEDVMVAADGGFTVQLAPVAGVNEVLVQSRDAAGNLTDRRLTYRYQPDTDSEIIFAASMIRDAAGRFLTAGDGLTLSAQVALETSVEVVNAQGLVLGRDQTDSAGQFRLNLPVDAENQTWEIRLTSASGYSYRQPIEVRKITTPPQINLAEPLPAFTASPTLTVAIQPEPDVAYSINGQPAQAAAAGAAVLPLQIELSKGRNTIEISARHRAGLVHVERRSVVLDSDAPTLTDSQIAVRAGARTERVTVRLAAEDASGLAKIIEFTSGYGDVEKKGVLRLNRRSRTYQGRVDLPKRTDDQPVYVRLILADIAGNRRELELQE